MSTSTTKTTGTNQLLTPNSHKYVVFAENNISPKVVEMCDRQEANLWLSTDVNLTQDAADWDKLSEKEQFYLKQILAFFASSDGIVGENLAINFLSECQVPEVRYFYYFQCMIEAVHAKVYSQLITTYIKSKKERDLLFDSIETNPIVKKKAEWAFKYMDPKQASFSQRLIGFLAVEGIFFAGSFAAIFWLRDRGILSNSLGLANEYISRDESIHAEFAALLYNEYCQDLSQAQIKEILLDALKIEKEFISLCIPDKLYGMNQELMYQHLEYITDTWLHELNVPKVFNVSQPFDFMDTVGQRRKDLFFEKRSANYARPKESSMDFQQIDL